MLWGLGVEGDDLWDLYSMECDEQVVGNQMMSVLELLKPFVQSRHTLIYITSPPASL